LGIETWLTEQAAYLRVDLSGRRHAVAVVRRHEFVEALALADTSIDPDRLIDALRENKNPGVAGLAVVASDTGSPLLMARAANLLSTLHDSELHRVLHDAGRRADAWEARFHGGDRW
jgi:hypothetical protein